MPRFNDDLMVKKKRAKAEPKQQHKTNRDPCGILLVTWGHLIIEIRKCNTEAVGEDESNDAGT